jgi:hypothetical protein
MLHYRGQSGTTESLAVGPDVVKAFFICGIFNGGVSGDFLLSSDMLINEF